MKLTSILLISAMLAMALTVAATPTPKDENSGSDDAGDDGSDQDSASAIPIHMTPESEQAYDRSRSNTVDGDGEQFCDIGNVDQSQCHTGYKCKAYKGHDDAKLPSLYGGTTVTSWEELFGLVSKDNLGTCVGKLDRNKD
ncbi:hypothetical protein BJ684DRAFT_21767 [Piptocephalis cylindrospora]|uniref:Uncharacterized protein n=1 Tax=Piptocephalis cylindrospora TaxID=1907219 RepID=A0A4P9XYX5_9FUNG|nr:hypothetical protein BJ684DRAFT_21767 [Piptocephalis cylindrospora]|eukprot:RKP11653.1 hypothetical protein BJ684DRAFT_21767 [Piptocephalis cylindrospora]